MNEPDANTRRFGLLASALCLGAIGLVLQAADGAAGYTTLELPLAKRTQAQLLMPEGWAFFTRSPREPWVHVYARELDADGAEGAAWVEISAPPLSHASNLFGLRRETRREGLESGIVIAALAEEAWAPCRLPELSTCLARASVVERIDNPSATPSLCGEVALVSYAAVPFAWIRNRPRSSLSEFAVPTRFAKVELTC